MPNGNQANESKSNGKPAFESWGRYPKLSPQVRPLFWAEEFPPKLPAGARMLPVGMGRSYGDVCLLEGGLLLRTTPMDRLLVFDPASGLLRCEAGVTLAEILDFAVPRGWFLPVTPGTKYVTLGGAIANDIHGKNHHVAGTIGCHVPRFELIRSDGRQFQCSAEENYEWYSATIGGMGLTGLISWAELQLRPIHSRRLRYKGTKFIGIDEFVALSRAAARTEYTVAWIDCVAKGKNFARGIFMQGDHSEEPAELRPSPEPKLTMPFDLPAFMLNRASVGAFNSLYYNKQLGKEKLGLVDYEPFFYPLDKILHWNRLYGKDGLFQFQCVLPWPNEYGMSAHTGMVRLLEAITESGLASFLAVIKVFGDIASPGMMSFPMPGITLALDFPIRPEVSFELMDKLADITAEFGGRMYPAKDACMSAAHYQYFYPRWQEFSAYVDPAFDSSFWRRVTALG
ncbi:MAG TPA: FAD-binding oxidoreductase [Acidobacteriaceae bacterium]|nr:FAD-binding oxidoreductase [Acidobacteriaceae bacterium]